ncbi:MAG: hypothetical protein AB8B69_04910, partial [Chitinophagales bacterium]
TNLPYLAAVLTSIGVYFTDNEGLVKAKLYCQRALEIYTVLARKNPNAYNLDVCMSSVNMVRYFYKKVQIEGYNTDVINSALGILRNTEKILQNYTENYRAQEYIYKVNALKYQFTEML